MIFLHSPNIFLTSLIINFILFLVFLTFTFLFICYFISCLVLWLEVTFPWGIISNQGSSVNTSSLLYCHIKLFKKIIINKTKKEGTLSKAIQHEKEELLGLLPVRLMTLKIDRLWIRIQEAVQIPNNGQPLPQVMESYGVDINTINQNPSSSSFKNTK